MTRDPEIILGFDVRADPSVPWADRGLRPKEYLLRDVPQPLAADSSVWPRRPTDSLQGARTFSPQGWQYWTVEDAQRAVTANQVVIAVTARTAGLEKQQAELRVASVGGAPSRSWTLLGYDIGDSGCLSGLSNCGYDKERDAWAATWGPRLNESRLVMDPLDADALAEATNARVPEHAPFAALGLYLVPSER